ncbi:sugar ABC transporter substrate-binding protein [Leifsonia sp. NPDC080035]|uniref:Sugar ABC transporter substrate-binding protein n=1 Tax=Leifsonia sp. NPDC080035 TaxID=3143936 RepID=A0AAU7GH23_9MICO
MRKRILAVAATAAAVAAALSGCSQGGDASGSGSTTITFAHWGNDQENATEQAMIAAFEKAHPDITVKANWVQNNYEQQLQTMIAGGTAPDVAQISNSSLGQFASTFAPVEVKGSDFYSENIAASMKFQGKYYAIPFTVKTKTMAVNKAVFEKAGVAVPSGTDPLNPDAYAKLATSLVSAGSPKTFGAAPLGFDQWLTIYGGSQFSADGKTCTYDSDAAVSAADQVIDAQSPDGYAPSQAEANGQDMFGWLTTGRVAMFPDFGPWSIAQLAQLPNSSDFALVPVPGKGSSMEIDGLAISSSSSQEKQAAAKTFATFMATDPAAQKLLTTAKSSLGLPVIEAAKASALAAAPDQNIAAFFSAVSQSTIAPSFSKTQSNINGTIETDLSTRTAVGSGHESPKKVLADLNTTCQKQLDAGE